MIIRPYPGFIIPERRFIDVGMAAPAAGMAGRYQLVVRDPCGIEKRRTPWFDNLILDSGLNRIGLGGSISGAAIGTGTTPPDVAQTALQTLSHWTTNQQTSNNTAAGASPHNNTYSTTYRTTLGALNGNYTEVGVGWASTSMFSRALIVDGVGNPTAISVASNEQLDISYQISVYPPLVDISSQVVIAGITHTVTGRASNVNSTGAAGGWPASVWVTQAMSYYSQSYLYTGPIGLITASPSGSAGGGTDTLIGSYSNNSLSRSKRTFWDLNLANLAGGCRSFFSVWYPCVFQYEFSPVIAKVATKTLSLDCSVTWARRP